MPNRFNQFIKNAILINLGVFAISIIVIISYMDNNNLSFPSIFEGSLFEVSFYDNYDWDVDVFDRASNASNQFDTLVLTEDNTFDLRDDILIESNMESVVFIHEDREDIRVVFEREVPDTSLYKVDYSAEVSTNRLVVRSHLSVRNLIVNSSYKGSITLYVPKDYECNSLTIESVFSNIDEKSIPENVGELFIKSDFGNVDMALEQRLNDFSLQMNTGNINLEINEAIDNVVLDTDGSSIKIDVDAPINEMKIINNVGSIEAKIKVAPETLDINCDVASVDLEFIDIINTMDIQSNMGDIKIEVDEEDNGIVYQTTELGDFKSDLDVTSSRMEANIFVSMDVGAVSIQK